MSIVVHNEESVEFGLKKLEAKYGPLSGDFRKNLATIPAIANVFNASNSGPNYL